MSNSFRIRTTPGINKNITVNIDQEFEYLEILSLKVLQQDLYTRTCSDYGVVIGRISINNGFGLPNVKVSIFIPLSDEDATNPLISTIYPYKTVTDVNEDGYRYNLLPYVQSHSNHTPTGTFFDRDDVLTNPLLIEVYDKYYKYTTTTNDSGDFMIFGVPTGQQTLFVDCDLSDIGEFSLVPKDLIRMGVATEDMVDKNRFKSSNNLNSLPQIVSFSRNIEVAPLWGEPELCSLGITRTDFDLSEQANIDIRPMAVFMGSIISTIDDTTVDDGCKPNKKLGELCSLTAGPGEIKAIRQTIEFDTDGRPFLEVFELQNAGQVIDNDGTWLIDLPMNLDYVITNEFGEQVISSDPTQGIPTKGKYRFKVKWNQPPDLTDPIKRAYYLVPNIREYGWTDGDENIPNSADERSSYAFSVNWDDYGDKTTTFGLSMIKDAIDCKDKFFEFKYNKVYTISNLITQYRNGYNKRRYISIKNILDEQCESENNKFPSNDAQKRTDIIFLLFTILLVLMYPVINSVMILMHIISFIVVVVLQPLLILFAVQFGIAATVEGIGAVAAFIPPGAPGLAVVHAAKSIGYLALVAGCVVLIVQIQKIKKYFQNFKLPNLTYPDCELCNCDAPGSADAEYVANQNNPGGGANKIPSNDKGTALLTPFTNSGLYSVYGNSDVKSNIFSGFNIPLQGAIGPGVGTTCLCNPADVEGVYCNQWEGYTQIVKKDDKGDEVEIKPWRYLSTDLPMPERINLFNVKAKYFNNTIPNVNFNNGITQNNGLKGVNQIKVRFAKELNSPGSTLNSLNLGTSCHLDNVLAVFINSELASELTAGKIITFQDANKSNDKNFTDFPENDYGTKSITGTSMLNTGTPVSVVVKWADPIGNNTNKQTTYNLTGSSINGNMFQAFPFDVEYFQVVTAMTFSQYSALQSNQLSNSFYRRHIMSDFYNIRMKRYGGGQCNVTDNDGYSVWGPGGLNFDKMTDQMVTILVRGVDPHSTRTTCEYDLSKLFGYSSFGNVVVNGENGKYKYKLNIPIQGGPKNIKHYGFTNGQTDSYSGQYLFHPSYQFKLNPAEFKTFDTSLTTYYSALDNDNRYVNGNAGTYSSGLGAQVGYYNVGQIGSTTKYYETYGNNAYLFRYNGGGSNWGPGPYNGSANKGFNYYEYEHVEGGSFITIFNIKFDTQDTTGGSCGNDDPACAETYYSTPKNNTTFKVNDSNRIVMRGDRLPLSTFDFQPTPNGQYRALHANPGFEVIILDDTGENAGVSVNTGVSDSDGELTGIGASLQCSGLAPFGCYQNNNGIVTVLDKSNECWQNGINNEMIMSKGCYIIVTVPLLSIVKDYILLSEWKSRLITSFAACRNVFGHVFTNNWVNGTLFAFPFDVVTNYNIDNVAIPEYCTQMLYWDKITNNIYYRSSRYSYNGYFVGAKRPKGVSEGNFRNLMYPTTIMDLGPRDLFIQEISVTDDYDGYVVDKLKSTTYNDISALLSLFLINRLTNKGFWSNLVNMSVNRYFGRENDFISGDYAQMNSINSEFSIVPYRTGSYRNVTDTYQSPSDDDTVFGVFFNNNQQNRDYISPKRTIITSNGPISTLGQECAFNNIPFKTQAVPFYLWEIKKNEGADSIFGSQKNEWFTNKTDYGSMYYHEYQLLDRVLQSSKYFKTTNQQKTSYFRSYIYSVGTALDSNGNAIPNGDISTWQQELPNVRDINTGAPFFFYFGLKKGNSAFDKFGRTWLDFEIDV